MKYAKPFLALAAAFFILTPASCATDQNADPKVQLKTAAAQVPQWSAGDMEFFLHGSMGSEFVPVEVLQAMMVTYPELFPAHDLSNFGLIPDPQSFWMIGFSRASPEHLGGMSSVGINCAACHVNEIESPGGRRIRILGGTADFDAEAFYNAVIGATFLTADPAKMKVFLAAYADPVDISGNQILSGPGPSRAQFDAAWDRQSAKVIAAMSADPAGAKGAGPGGLQQISMADLLIPNMSHIEDVDLAAKSVAMLKLFHNMRASLHIPDSPPEKLPPSSGPGRNDAFGLLSAELFHAAVPYGPVKYGVVWDVAKRPAVHWDGNTLSPIARNIFASLGLGAPLIDNHAQLDFNLIQRQTDLSQMIKPPRYPFEIDKAAAARGKATYQSTCAKCHDGPQDDTRLYSPAEIGTDPIRADSFTPLQADRFDNFLKQVQIDGYTGSKDRIFRSTQKYWSPSLAGVWARSPYLHNGSVRTMRELLTAPENRPVSFQRGSRIYDTTNMGYSNAGPYRLDTKLPGNHNTGHDYGTKLSAEQKSDLIEYLKTL